MAKKVYIDPGHGGNDSGAVGIDGALEKTVNLEMALKVEKLLKNQDLDVRLTRKDDRTLSLKERVDLANNWSADCFVSIHCNAFNKEAKGVETYSLNDKTSDLAKDIQEEILKTGAYTLNRGVKTANFYVLRNTKMRACLVELGFIDNFDDIKIMTEKDDEIATAIAKGICKFLKVEYKPRVDLEPVNPPIQDSDTFYRVVCGSFNNKVNAEERIEELKEKGFDDCFITMFKK